MRLKNKRKQSLIIFTAVLLVLCCFIAYPKTTRAINFLDCPIYVSPVVTPGTGGGGTGGGGTGGVTPGLPGTPGAGATALIAKGCEYIKNPSLYDHEKEKGVTDCYGFVVTALRHSGVDPSALVNTLAGEAIKNYYNKHSDKYQIIHPVTSTKQLQPGDMLFNVDYGSHAMLYVGPGYCGCPGGVLGASIGKHAYRPKCKSWYSDMSWAVRLK